MNPFFYSFLILTDRKWAVHHEATVSQAYTMLYGVPQGSVLGPKLFSQHAEDVTEILERCMQHHHIYADDMQGLRHGKPADILQIVTQVENGINEIARWCASRRLQLNQSKTEIMWFGTAANLKKLSSEDQRVAIGSSRIEPSSSVRNLGVYLDSQMTMKEHVTRTARICFHHIRRLWGIRQRLNRETTARLVSALIISRLDYCNAALSGLSAAALQPLQRVMNAAARLVLN
jgi:Reverse transcriptase (RNA-dependent DNA polymerase)